MSADLKLASALGSAAGWKRQADKHEHSKKVAQARARRQPVIRIPHRGDIEAATPESSTLTSTNSQSEKDTN